MAINISANDANLNRSPEAQYTPRPPQRLGGLLAPGTAIANGDTNKVVIPVLGSGRVRVRALVTGAAATLQAAYRLADKRTNSATKKPADVALVAATENIMDVIDCAGEEYLEIAILSAGAVIVSFVDVDQVPL